MPLAFFVSEWKQRERERFCFVCVCVNEKEKSKYVVKIRMQKDQQNSRKGNIARLINEIKGSESKTLNFVCDLKPLKS